MKDFKRFNGRVYGYAGLFPPKFAKEYAQKHRKGGWRIRLEKVRNVLIKGKLYRVAYKMWQGGNL